MNECFEADPDVAAKGVWVEVFSSFFFKNGLKKVSGVGGVSGVRVE
jgi:hypothetical protein